MVRRTPPAVCNGHMYHAEVVNIAGIAASKGVRNGSVVAEVNGISAADRSMAEVTHRLSAAAQKRPLSISFLDEDRITITDNNSSNGSSAKVQAPPLPSTKPPPSRRESLSATAGSQQPPRVRGGASTDSSQPPSLPKSRPPPLPKSKPPPRPQLTEQVKLRMQRRLSQRQ